MCRSEGFEAHTRVTIRSGTTSIVAMVEIMLGDQIGRGDVALSEAAWRRLAPQEGEELAISHAEPVDSLTAVRGKIYGRRFEPSDLDAIMQDITAGRYADVDLAAFVAACGGDRLDLEEVVALTRAMIASGDTLTWDRPLVVDKHCIGGLPGNRTTLLVVPIVAAAGLWMPKTSSRAITSPAGTADTAEVLFPVDLSLEKMRAVVEREGGCIAWGGAVHLSPADDVLIRVERALDVDSEGQLAASVLSKKAAAGSTHVILDIPVGPTAKVRNLERGRRLALLLERVAEAVGLRVRTVISDGSQPVGRGIGPALEARDVVQVLRNEPGAPDDLRERSVALAGPLLELGGVAAVGQGAALAEALVRDGRAWARLQAIAEAQGGLREVPPLAEHRHEITAPFDGQVRAIHNRDVSRVAKLAGAPEARRAGIDLYVRNGARVAAGQPLFSLYAETPGELAYALDYLRGRPPIVTVERA